MFLRIARVRSTEQSGGSLGQRVKAWMKACFQDKLGAKYLLPQASFLKGNMHKQCDAAKYDRKRHIYISSDAIP